MKFTKQKPLLDYVVDFYCSELALVIEIDGDTHAEQEQYDENRTKNLKKFGLQIIRYTNKDVIENTEGVFQDFLKIIENRKNTPLPPLQGGLKEAKFTSARTEKSENIQLSQTLEEAKKRNETANSRVIGMAIETRPDWINIDEIKRLRRYGITRVEIGYQTTHDHINELNKRGHGNKESIEATKMLKDAGFKVVAHMMPGLVGATPELDKSAMKEIFDNQLFRPDELKIYPLVVTPNSELTKLWEAGEFEPYDDAKLIPLMAELQSYLPEYIRLNRMYRDIPAHEILAGSKTANLRQVTEIAMRAKNLTRHDISAREIRAKGNSPDNAVLDVSFYEASDGHEYFIQMIDPTDRTIFGLTRLRVPSQYFSGEKHFIEELDNSALIREVHVFGDQIPVGFSGDHSGQHQGFGKKMLAEAEKIIQEKYPTIKRMAIISGVGVRAYYEKRGYKLE